MQFTRELREEYELRFATCVIDAKRSEGIEHAVTTVLYGRKRYEHVSRELGMPWYVVGLIHLMEASGSFLCHLHNGDPLTAKTVHVPKNRPAEGEPPFPWEASAIDALTFDGFASWKDWSLSGTLYKLEAFNGWGYRSRSVATPYLWGGCSAYRAGKFVADGVFSPGAVSRQIGAAVVLRRLVDQGFVSFASPDAKCVGLT